MNEIVYLNGAYLPLQEARVSVTDYGFLFGYGLYETMRTYAGKFFRLDAHLERLARAAEVLVIPLHIPAIKEAVLATNLRNGLAEARVRITVTAGEGSLTPDLGTCSLPTVLVTATKYKPLSAEVYERGFQTVVSALHRNSQSPLPGLKTASFLESLLARKAARTAGADDALLFNDKGQLAEASSSNVFLVNRGVLRTPRLGAGLLPGVTRAVVMELAFGLGISTVEADISRAELLLGDEVFLTNSMIEIMPVTGVDGHAVGSGKPGAITRRLMAACKELVAKEVATNGSDES